jgi:hypothetical protein
MVDPAFDDPTSVMDLIHRHAPYPQLMAVYGNKANTYDRGRVEPWFRSIWAANERTIVDGVEPVFRNPRFIAAAQKSFRTEIVRPLSLIINIHAPMREGRRHMDAPYFRGAIDPKLSALRLCMGASGLFRHWEVLAASAIAWFHTGTGGSFDYWPDGPDTSHTSITPPMWNVALVSDNEYMYHRVGAVGDPADYLRDHVISESTLLTWATNGWELENITDSRGVRYTDSQIRISVLWKAFVFADAKAQRLFDAHNDDLTVDMIIDIFREDLAKRGVSVRAPDDPVADIAWNEVLAHHYPSAYFSR